MGKKVCILTSVHLPFDTRIFHKQAKSLVTAGYDVTLIAQHDKDEVVDRIKIISLPKAKNRFWRMVGTWRVFKLAYGQRAEVYHFHDPELLPVGLFLKLLKRGKVIYDVHEDYPKEILTKYWLPSISRKPLSCLFNFIEKSASCRLDFIIAVTDGLRAEFKKGKRATVRNYPILEDIQPERRFELQNPSLIYAGSLTEIRGIGEIVQAMEHVDPSKNIKLILCGTFSPESYEQKVRRLKGFEKVEYVEWVKQEEVWLKLSHATIGIVCFHPTLNHINSMPNKLFEYMAAGLPVIASNFPLWKEIIEGDNCGLTVNPLDPSEIARAIEYLLEHPDEARRMGENGRKAVIEKYNWETESKLLLRVYDDLLKEGR